MLCSRVYISPLLMCLVGLGFAWGLGHAAEGARGLGIVREGGPTVPLSVYQNSWAVIIGINTYKSPEVPQLRYAVNDALSIKASLEPLGFPAHQVLTLLNEQATRHNIEQVLYERLRDAQKDDRLLVFFAGHGKTQELPRGIAEGFLLPYDADPENPFTSAISMSDVRRIGQRIAAKHILFVVDACHSGFAATRAVTPSAVDAEYLRLVTQAPAVQVITAGTSQELAREEDGHGVFTNQLLKGLAGFADTDWNGLVTGAELAAFLQNRVARETEGGQNPQFGQLSGEGQFLFILPYKKEETAAQPAPVSETRADTLPRAHALAAAEPDAEMWEFVRNSSHPEDLLEFLKAYPQSRYEPAARLRLHQLQRQQGAAGRPTTLGEPVSSTLSEQQRLAKEWYLKSKVYISAENYPDALAALTKAIELDPQHGGAYRERGMVQARLENYQAARRDLMQATALNTQDAEAYRECGRVCMMLGDYTHAVHQLDRAITLEPRDNQAYTFRGMAYRSMNNYPQAVRDLNKAVELAPQEAEAYRERGITRGEMGNYEQAMRDLNSAIRLAPQDTWAYVQRGEMYSKQANDRGAMQNFTRAIEMANHDMQAGSQQARAYLHRGVAYALSGKYEEAIRDLDKAIELQPQFASAYRERGEAYAELRIYPRALQDLDEAVRLNPFDASAYYQRGMLYSKLSNYLPAIQDLNKALELHPHMAAAYRERGLVHKKMGNDDKARADIQKAKQIEDAATR